MTSDAVRQAARIASSGQQAAAVALLEHAGDRGDIDALMQLAVWRLIGDVLPRDLPAARALLARAVAIGHVDGALMEVALTANGSGGRADWGAARALLDTAAASDPVAAAQCNLLDAMALSPDGAPAALPPAEVLSTAPLIVRYPALLTPAECAHVAGATADSLQPAAVLDPRSGRRIAHPVRTSDDAVIGPTREDLVVRAINLRVAAASRTPVENGEPLTVLRYRPGQQYRPHLDTIAGAVNQRVATVLLYLNEGYGGGETVFPDPNVTIVPRGGDAIVFANVDAQGRPDPRSRHAGLPVTYGVKWLATRWIRSAAIDPWTIAAPA
jgi:prolyl 4-hydroxylase